jgi:hypothetical protein
MAGRNPPTHLHEPFVSVFKAVSVRAFGAPSLGYEGLCDAVAGVQWNAWTEDSTGGAFVGVNLEGLAYGGEWPITRFILNELRAPRLPVVAMRLEMPAAVELRFLRDAWQVTARPRILEASIAPSPTTLDRLRADDWARMLSGALACLRPDKDHRGRAVQHVTRVGASVPVQMEVSPHLQFRCRLPVDVVRSREAMVAGMLAARERLLPLREFVQAVSA